jgi:hypothetical protein
VISDGEHEKDSDASLEALGNEFGPDLQKWVRHFDGYNRIPWDRWDAEKAKAEARRASKRGAATREST